MTNSEKFIPGKSSECKDCLRVVNSESGIEVICGPMFSSKSEVLISKLRQAIYSKQNVIAFQPIVDNRRGLGTINTYNHDSFPATPVQRSEDILDYIKKNPQIDVVGIDEGNFFDMNLPAVANELADMGKKVIITGLDRNFRGEGFGPMTQLKLEADEITQLSARCVVCGKKASRTQRVRIIDGKRIPANYNDPVVLVGEEEYEPRCRFHHEVPGKRKD